MNLTFIASAKPSAPALRIKFQLIFMDFKEMLTAGKKKQREKRYNSHLNYSVKLLFVPDWRSRYFTAYLLKHMTHSKYAHVL